MQSFNFNIFYPFIQFKLYYVNKKQSFVIADSDLLYMTLFVFKWKCSSQVHKTKILDRKISMLTIVSDLFTCQLLGKVNIKTLHPLKVCIGVSLLAHLVLYLHQTRHREDHCKHTEIFNSCNYLRNVKFFMFPL